MKPVSAHSLSALTAACLLSIGSFAFAQADGKKLVDGTCNTCHPLAARVGSGYTPDGWKTVIRMMMNQGAPVAPENVPAMLDYLTKTYPEQAKPEGKLIAGPAKVKMQQWDAPTPGSRPHDPLAARDGSLWYTGQMANVLGRIDPKAGKIKEYPLKTPHSGPHGLKEDRQGNVWYTGNTSALIGKLNPKTGAITEYKMPDPAMDPHTLVFDKRGILWFTAQNANRIGRLDPKTGDIKLLTPPTAKSRPYGMALDSRNDNLFVVQFGANSIVRVNTKTLEMKEYKLPNEKARPRRVAVTPDDMVWYTDYARGYLGRLNPKTGEVKEWLSPAGEKSAPYGVSAIKGVLWYSESEAKPVTVVRFDPKTQKFQSWPIPGGGNIVRNTDVTKDGNFVLANSLNNQVTLVRIGK